MGKDINRERTVRAVKGIGFILGGWLFVVFAALLFRELAVKVSVIYVTHSVTCYSELTRACKLRTLMGNSSISSPPTALLSSRKITPRSTPSSGRSLLLSLASFA